MTLVKTGGSKLGGILEAGGKQSVFFTFFLFSVVALSDSRPLLNEALLLGVFDDNRLVGRCLFFFPALTDRKAEKYLLNIFFKGENIWH